jgi:hypothetical protein
VHSGLEEIALVARGFREESGAFAAAVAQPGRRASRSSEAVIGETESDGWDGEFERRTIIFFCVQAVSL